MGYKLIELTLPTDYSEALLESSIGKMLRIKEFTYSIETKSLDARKKNAIHWLMRIGVQSPELRTTDDPKEDTLKIPYRKRNQKVVVVGSGPAGFFAAFVLQKAGFETMILERGAEVSKRAEGIKHFEATSEFSAIANYSFGEGGAGTFSDGKLTSRSKRISRERAFVLDSYVEAGAPEEIRYMTHPHVGSDNLKNIVRTIRDQYQKLGGTIHFETQLNDLEVEGDKVTGATTDADSMCADYVVLATGHSAYETYRMLIRRGVGFRTKRFALGCRAEHRQEAINESQWGVKCLPGVKAAEYRLTSKADGNHSVYSFCMCPGGSVVPAAAYEHTNSVNGMSYYQRGGPFANAACVAGVHPDQLAGKVLDPLEALDWIENLEVSFYDYSHGYAAPFCSIDNFIKGTMPNHTPDTSYPLGLKAAPLWEMLPAPIVASLRVGLREFDRKIRGYSNGNLLGLESKTSAPIQVIREKSGVCSGFKNLFVVGEGSGHAGGIVSSAADGIKAALQILEKEV